jgi:hypothetical protein
MTRREFTTLLGGSGGSGHSPPTHRILVASAAHDSVFQARVAAIQQGLGAIGLDRRPQPEHHRWTPPPGRPYRKDRQALQKR